MMIIPWTVESAIHTATSSDFLSEAIYQELEIYMKKVKVTTNRESQDDWMLNHYYVMQIENKSKKICPV